MLKVSGRVQHQHLFPFGLSVFVSSMVYGHTALPYYESTVQYMYVLPFLSLSFTPDLFSSRLGHNNNNEKKFSGGGSGI